MDLINSVLDLAQTLIPPPYNAAVFFVRGIVSQVDQSKLDDVNKAKFAGYVTEFFQKLNDASKIEGLSWESARIAAEAELMELIQPLGILKTWRPPQ